MLRFLLPTLPMAASVREHRRAQSRTLALFWIALICAISCALLPMLAQRAYAGTIAVDGTTCTLPVAIVAANTDANSGGCVLVGGGSGDPDTLSLAAGAHNLTANHTTLNGDNGTAPVISGSDVTIVGDASGSTIARVSAADFRLLYVAAGGKLTVDNVTLTNGDASVNTYGGAIYSAGALTVTDSIIMSNTAYAGGAIAVVDGTATFSDTDILTNTATDITFGGGGLFVVTGTVDIANSGFYSNSVTGFGGGFGGGFYVVRGTVDIANSDFYTNSASLGGGFAVQHATVTITNSRVLTNSASIVGGGFSNGESGVVEMTNSTVGGNNAQGGGGFDNRSATTKETTMVTLINSDVISNVASGGGGGVVNHNATTILLSNSEIRGNIAPVGGGILNSSGGLIFGTNAFIADNDATVTDGGGLSNDASEIIFQDSQFTGNHAADNGGGIVNFGTNATAILTNTDLLGNSADNDGGGLQNSSNGFVSSAGGSVAGNIATNYGGGIATLGATTLITDVILRSNEAGLGGGISGRSAATITVINSEILTHVLSIIGGGAIVDASTLTLTGSLIEGNEAGSGGGLLVTGEGGKAVINDTIIRHNEAGLGGGIHNNSGGQVFLTDSQVITNVGQTDGGGIYNETGSTFLTNSSVLSNTAVARGGGTFSTFATGLVFNGGTVAANSAAEGGGLFNEDGSIILMTGLTVRDNSALVGNGGGIYNAGSFLHIMDSLVTSNTSADAGGGLFNFTASNTTTIINSVFATNTAEFIGGAIQNFDSTMVVISSTLRANQTLDVPGGGALAHSTGTLIITGSTFISNTTAGDGGGLFSPFGFSAITDTLFVSNEATGNGGGLYFGPDVNNVISISNTVVTSNRASAGGGLFMQEHDTDITNSTFSLNHADTEGGAISASTFGHLTIQNSDVTTNTSDGVGGGVTIGDGVSATITATRLLANFAPFGGGAIQTNSNEPIAVNESCIVNNSDLAFTYATGASPVATENWWGAPDGPSGDFPGSGDSANSGVIVTPFKTAPILDCPYFDIDLAFSKVVAPAGALLPGQPVTYTLAITNNDNRFVKIILISDTLPAGFVQSSVTFSGVPVTTDSEGFHIAQMNPSEFAIITIIGAVSDTLNSDITLHNSAVLSNVVTGEVTVTTDSPVIVPLLNWSNASYSANEEDGGMNATLTLSPINPYADASVQVVTTETLDTSSFSTAAVQNATVFAGNASQTVPISFGNDEGVGARSIELALQNPIGAALGPQSSATVIIDEDDQVGLTVDKSANVTQASAGDTITYTYRITNTGNVTLTIAAHDNRLGSVADLGGQLAPQATASATLNYTVQESDPLGALVNTVTVTGTDSLDTDVVVADSYTVNIIGNPTNLPEGEQPQQGTQIFLPRLSNSKEE